MQALASKPLAMVGKQAIIGDLASSFTPALLYRESRHWAHAISRVAQRSERLAETEAQRTDHARGDNRDPGGGPFTICAA